MSLNHRRVISEGNLRLLAEAGQVSETNQPGCRRVSTQYISPFASRDTLDIPDFFNSAAALVFCGMQPAVAENLFDEWQNLPEEHFAYGHDIDRLGKNYIELRAAAVDAWLPEPQHDWEAALEHQGIKLSTRQGIMDPEYRDIRLSGTASEWALDTFICNWDFLASLEERVAHTFERLGGEKKITGDRSGSPDPSTPASTSRQPTSQSPQ
ncbi:hypothetical protein L228DRAFT_143430 [Xylona heveae TC161]|uniref:Uncharacterized protein n=1 Tax=Xylona heveae (strain CBS 132557 / TC161) TaxID=1328760 RepID=A0A165H7L3_XYLHT|nr:hypothetical protein L228DRAFT_143430 [Xylona heveae TC161]KZF23096.1 hypothetical protein L228DRAFT_143430 [Xylona heveae TC161]